MYTILTFWSTDNILAKKKLNDRVQAKIDEKWKSVRYRRVWYYFFEKEIQQDIQQQIASSSLGEYTSLRDPEYQSLIARAGQRSTDIQGVFRDEATVLCNNYLFGQDIFSGSNEENDELFMQQFISLISTGDGPEFFTMNEYWMSDVLLQVRRARTDIQLVEAIVNGEHTYKTLLRACGEYIGTFAVLPRFVELLGTGWNTETLLSVFEEASQLRLHALLQPSYQISCVLLSQAIIQPYGYVDVINTPYANVMSRFGGRWSQRAWYVKLLFVLAIIFISAWIGGSSLIVLPIIRGLFAMGRTAWQYLSLFQQSLGVWYHHYNSQHTNYLNLYDMMIDPETSTHKSIKAQQLMNRRYDIAPFSGHELVRDATQYAKILYEAVMSAVTNNVSDSKNLSMISAVWQRGQEHNLSLLIVRDGKYTEQVLYRFEQLLELAKKLHSDNFDQDHYTETYELIDDLISTKRYNFRFWTFRNALRDGLLVGVSSGVIGWLGSYLRNRGITSNSALAAGPGLLSHTVSQSDDVLLSHTELREVMGEVMTPSDVDTFFTFVDTNTSPTLWDTMVNLFGEHQGNIYTNHLMDQWWRIQSSDGGSILFEQALKHDLPVSVDQAGRSGMKSLLYRIYDYDNLIEYSSLLDQDWLPQTLQGLKDGSINMEQFSQMDIQQREIITQAMFYNYPQEQLSTLFDSQVIDTSDTLSRGDKILQFFEKWKSSFNTHTTGDISIVDQTGSMIEERRDSWFGSLKARFSTRRDSLNWKWFSGDMTVDSGYSIGKMSPFTFPVIKKDKKME